MNNLKKLRESRKLSQQQIADILNIKQQTYAYFESGNGGVRESHLLILSDFYGVPIDTLLGRDEIDEVLERNAKYYRSLINKRKKGE